MKRVNYLKLTCDNDVNLQMIRVVQACKYRGTATKSCGALLLDDYFGSDDKQEFDKACEDYRNYGATVEVEE